MLKDCYSTGQHYYNPSVVSFKVSPNLSSETIESAVFSGHRLVAATKSYIGISNFDWARTNTDSHEQVMDSSLLEQPRYFNLIPRSDCEEGSLVPAYNSEYNTSLLAIVKPSQPLANLPIYQVTDNRLERINHFAIASPGIKDINGEDVDLQKLIIADRFINGGDWQEQWLCYHPETYQLVLLEHDICYNNNKAVMYCNHSVAAREDVLASVKSLGQ